VQIVLAPQRDEIRPRPVVVTLHAYPRLLVVAGKDEIVGRLRAYEARVVVRRGIDQMADDLLARPLAGGARRARISIRGCQHPIGAAGDGRSERIEELDIDRHAAKCTRRSG
jgi:hypothetical protein